MSEVKVEGKHKTSWVTISMDEYTSMKSTIEILSDPKLREEALKGKLQAIKGKTRSLDEVAKELGF